MIKDVIWLFPIICLLGSILYCSIRLTKEYKSSIHIYVNQFLEKMGLWKTGIGRWKRLSLYLNCYVVATICSIIIFVFTSANSEAGVIEQISTFAERFSIVEMRKLLATILFAVETIVISLMMYGRNFSKEKSKHFNFLGFFAKNIIDIVSAILVWLLLGISAYKDWLYRTINEYFSSPGRAFQLCWGIVSVVIFSFAIFNSLREIRELR